jgi:hypothetical protein
VVECFPSEIWTHRRSQHRIEKIKSTLGSTIRRFTPHENKNNTVHNEHLKSTLVLDIMQKDIGNFLCFRNFFFSQRQWGYRRWFLFFGMKSHNASISTRQYRYRYPFYVTLTWYGMFMQKLREKIECKKETWYHTLKADPVPAEAVKRKN